MKSIRTKELDFGLKREYNFDTENCPQQELDKALQTFYVQPLRVSFLLYTLYTYYKRTINIVTNNFQVSRGAECIMISKKFFMEHANALTKRWLRLNVSIMVLLRRIFTCLPQLFATKGTLNSYECKFFAESLFKFQTLVSQGRSVKWRPGGGALFIFSSLTHRVPWTLTESSHNISHLKV